MSALFIRIDTSPSPLTLKLLDGSAAVSPAQVLETFREYFHSILNSLKLSTFPRLHNGSFNTPLESVDFRILDIRKRLNPHSSMEPDNVHSRIIKEAADAPAPVFTFRFKNVLKTGRSQVSGGRLPSLRFTRKETIIPHLATGVFV